MRYFFTLRKPICHKSEIKEKSLRSYVFLLYSLFQSLEPWLASEVKVSGEIKLLSVIASGLPTSEEVDHVVDLELLKAPPLPVNKTANLVIGVFSNANNFKRRMSIRRTWMQYDAVRSGSVVVRFFVGLVRITMEVLNDMEKN